MVNNTRIRESQSRYSHRIQTVIIFSGVVLTLIGLIGALIDLSLIYARYSILQQVVDSAVVAAAVEVGQDTDDVVLNQTIQQLFESYKVVPLDVFIQTCDSVAGSSNTDVFLPIPLPADDMCEAQLRGREPVRVVARMAVPTVFFYFLGVDDIVVKAESISYVPDTGS